VSWLGPLRVAPETQRCAAPLRFPRVRSALPARPRVPAQLRVVLAALPGLEELAGVPPGAPYPASVLD
jgi:hypothetical protein